MNLRASISPADGDRLRARRIGEVGTLRTAAEKLISVRSGAGFRQ